MMPYILQVAVILTVCFLFYKLFLQRATFYGLNRWTLFSCLILSFVLPLVPAPRGWSWNTDAPSQRTPLQDATLPTTIATLPAAPEPTRLVAPQPSHPAAPESSRAMAPQPSHPAAAQPSHPFSVLLSQGLQILTYAYLLGLLVFGLKFAFQLILLCHRSFSRPVIRDGRYRIVQTDGERGPCTFANTIFINPTLYDRETFQQILVHEKVHVRGGHSLDILFAELAVVFQWFNPFAWLYRREVENNLEFLTDQSVLEHPEIERSAYQLSLLRVSAPYLPFSITNNYNHSLLKRRIVMMNSQHSARHTIWKYLALLPIFILLICLLNKPAALAQSAQANTGRQQSRAAKTSVANADTAIRPSRANAGPATKAATTTRTDETISTGDTPDGQTIISITRVDPTVTTVTTINGTFVVQPAIHADPVIAVSADPAIAAMATASSEAGTYSVGNGVPDTSFPHSDNLDLRQGSWFLTVDSDNLEFLLRAQAGENSWQSSFMVKKSEINPYPGQGTVEFKLVREAGTLTFKGSFDGEQGLGHFQFQPDVNYNDEMKKMGVEDMDEGRYHSFFLLNITKDYVRMLARNGYTPIEQREVVTLAIRKVDEAYIEELKKAGYTHLTVQQLTGLKRQKIDRNHARAINSADVDVNRLGYLRPI